MTTRICEGCGYHFWPEGKATICGTCEFLGFFRRTCSVCGTQFDTRDLGRWKCCFCADSSAETNHLNREEADYHFDASTDT